MESKTRNSYESVFSFIKNNLLTTLRPEIILTDYETALLDILTSTFPGARTAGCWFHHNYVRLINITLCLVDVNLPLFM